MIPEVSVYAQVAVITVALVSSLATVGVLTTRAIRWAARRDELPPARNVEERLLQLQQSVDAIAVEVERVAEAQRFSARLLAERSEDPSLPARR